ncbi:aminodeoxychorismate lyase [Pseudidiomarina taiwanensis]|uniref:Aminodeoxychorismate lyase n=1 Tax=Pseudidiomarina taiwanensis TaxID=337250 RepID=A0A432ZND8_9GAMM|nr:aminodeoxychorismate lyase [Pseudidiomarina taiwanensis]RUO79409.1 aminodeoxychorismate lyase [Pseudidiomarina taiwanensis]
MWMNGEKQPQSELDRGLQFGDGHFTTLRVEQGQMIWWPSHWQRLQEASERLAIPLPAQNEIQACVKRASAGLGSAAVKIILTRGDSARGYGIGAGLSSNFYITATEITPRHLTKTELKADFAQFKLAQQPVFAGLKTLNRLEQVWLSRERDMRGLDELIACDSAGHVIAATSSNVLYRNNGIWYTPQLDNCGIFGVTLKQLIQQQVLGPVEFCETTVDAIRSADALVLSNCILGPRVVSEFAGKLFDNGKLERILQQWWDSELSQN